MKNTTFASITFVAFVGLVCMALSSAPAFAGEGCEHGAGAAAVQGDAAAAAPAAAVAGDDKVYVLGIEGMSCPINCAPNVKTSIESIKGVRSAEVSYEEKRAVVHTDPDVELTTAQIDKSFNNQGYFVSSLEVQAKAQ